MRQIERNNLPLALLAPQVKALPSLTRGGRHGRVLRLKSIKEVASMWWAKTGFKIAYASIVGVWAVLMFVAFT